MADETLLVAEIAELRGELAKLNEHRFIKAHNSLRKMVLFQFYRGLAFGLGTVIGATILVFVVGYFLSSINFIPILGEWAAEVLSIMDAGR